MMRGIQKSWSQCSTMRTFLEKGSFIYKMAERALWPNQQNGENQIVAFNLTIYVCNMKKRLELIFLTIYTLQFWPNHDFLAQTVYI